MSSFPRVTTEQEEPTRPGSLWRNRDFVLLWSGQIVSAVGTQVSMLAFPLLILAVTHSPAEAGLLGALRSLPFIILTLPVGALIDRWDRKRTMIVSDTGRAIALGSIPVALFAGHLTLWQLAAVALIEGALFTFFNVAEAASLAQVVTKEQLPDAIGLNSAVDSASVLVGPALSGALYAAGRALPFLVDAVSYAVSVLSMLFIKVEFQQERANEPGNLWGEIFAGISWLWRRPVLRFLALLVGGLNLCSFGYPIIMIVRAQQLHAGPLVIGLLFATGGIGSALGSLTIGPLQRRFTVGQLMVGGAWVWALTWLPYAVAPNIFLFGIANIIGWLIVPIFMGIQYSYRLTIVSDELQGRVNSVFKLLAFGPEPIALAIAGLLVQAFGPVSTVLILVVPQLALCVLATLHVQLRETPRLTELPHG